MPFPPPQLMPPGGTATPLWPSAPVAAAAAAALQLNPLLLGLAPGMVPMPIPPTVTAAAASNDALLGAPYLKKPLSEKEFYAKQRELGKKSGETNMRRLEAKSVLSVKLKEKVELF